MIHARKINDIVAVQNNLASQLVHVLTNLSVLDHDNDHIDICEESVKIVVLVLDHILGNERIIDLQIGFAKWRSWLSSSCSVGDSRISSTFSL